MDSVIVAIPKPTEEVTQKIRVMHPVLSERHEEEDQKVREAIETLTTADTDVVFLNFLAILPCLEKLGNDFLAFKRPSMLTDDHADFNTAASMLDTLVENFQRDVQNLQQFLTRKLELPQPEGFKRPETEESIIRERLELSCHNPVQISPTPGIELPDSSVAQQSDVHARRASISISKPASADLNKVHKSAPRASHACGTCKRRKSKCGKNRTCEVVLAASLAACRKQGKSSIFPEYITPTPFLESPNGNSLAYSDQSSIAITPTDVGNFGDVGIPPRDLNADFGPILGPDALANTHFDGDYSFDGHISYGDDSLAGWENGLDDFIITPSCADFDVSCAPMGVSACPDGDPSFGDWDATGWQVEAPYTENALTNNEMATETNGHTSGVDTNTSSV